MLRTTCSDGRRFAGVLASWIDAVLEGDGGREARRRGEAARLARCLKSDPVLGPALMRHRSGGAPVGEVGAVAIMAADESAVGGGPAQLTGLRVRRVLQSPSARRPAPPRSGPALLRGQRWGRELRSREEA